MHPQEDPNGINSKIVVSVTEYLFNLSTLDPDELAKYHHDKKSPRFVSPRASAIPLDSFSSCSLKSVISGDDTGLPR